MRRSLILESCLQHPASGGRPPVGESHPLLSLHSVPTRSTCIPTKFLFILSCHLPPLNVEPLMLTSFSKSHVINPGSFSYDAFENTHRRLFYGTNSLSSFEHSSWSTLSGHFLVLIPSCQLVSLTQVTSQTLWRTVYEDK